MKIIDAAEFDGYWGTLGAHEEDEKVVSAVRDIIAGVRKEGGAAVREFAARFDRSAPENPLVPPEAVEQAYRAVQQDEPELVDSLVFAARNIGEFARRQREQFTDFEFEIAPGLFTGQRVIPVERAAIYAPGGRFPLVSSVLMGIIPARAAGVQEAILVSPPGEDGLPDRRILAAARLAGAGRVFALGGAQAVAALALGVPCGPATIPRVDVIAGPGNKYVAAAKRLLYGEVGIDFVAGPTDVLIIADGRDPDLRTTTAGRAACEDLIAADLLAQAEHDPDARARALLPGRDLAGRVESAVEKRLAALPTAAVARASLDAGGLIVVYPSMEAAVRIANIVAPEHLELQVENPASWIPALRNYGSLFVGSRAAEVLGDYSAGINHTLPTSGSARFSAGLSVRHFLKTPTSLRCVSGSGFDAARRAAERMAGAEGLAGHGAAAAARAYVR
ncbi:MAG: histidinol dehydrogenase [Treponema sp.]|jgi:histidinol dehydrogenase|nr:histidinol dehydrogenase [Treponema sp.]